MGGIQATARPRRARAGNEFEVSFCNWAPRDLSKCSFIGATTLHACAADTYTCALQRIVQNGRVTCGCTSTDHVKSSPVKSSTLEARHRQPLPQRVRSKRTRVCVASHASRARSPQHRSVTRHHAHTYRLTGAKHEECSRAPEPAFTLSLNEPCGAGMLRRSPLACPGR